MHGLFTCTEKLVSEDEFVWRACDRVWNAPSALVSERLRSMARGGWTQNSARPPGLCNWRARVSLLHLRKRFEQRRHMLVRRYGWGHSHWNHSINDSLELCIITIVWPLQAWVYVSQLQSSKSKQAIFVQCTKISRERPPAYFSPITTNEKRERL
jgi:hypothetical protein